MRAVMKIVATFAVGLLLQGKCIAEPLELRHNPFARPPSVVTVVDREGSRLRESSIEPVVLATLVASRNKLANVDGRILRPGDEIYGYTLVRVFENRAVFERQGSSITVYVKPQLEEGDD